MSAERQRRYRARIGANAQKKAEFLMKHRVWKKKDVTTAQCESAYAVPHNEARHIETKEPESLVKIPCMLPLCHPFTAVVAGPTGCGKTAWSCVLSTMCDRR